MTSFSRFLFISMCTAFGLCCLGILIGLIHGFYATAYQHRTLEDILGQSIPYYRLLGGIGITGFLLFFAFLASAVSHKKQDKSQ